MTHVTVVGGGITGLAAAFDLARAGVRVTLVEGGDAFGGKVGTDALDGFLVERGPDSVVAYRPAALRLVSDVGLADEVIGTAEPRAVYLRRAGRLVPLPEGMGLVLPTRLRPFVGTPLLTWPQKLRAGLDLVLPRRLDADDVAIGAFLRARLGAGIVTGIANPLVGGVYGADVDDLSLDAVLPQLRTYEQTHRSLLLASLAQGRAARAAQADGPPSGGSPFRSLRRGMGSLVDALVATLGAASGVEVRLGARATSLRTEGSGSVVGLAGGERIRADAVVLATDATAAAALLGEEAPDAAALVGGIRLGTSAVVSLGYPEEAFRTAPPGHGVLEADAHPASFSAVTVSSAKWAGRAPDGHVLLRASLPSRSAALSGLPDAQVLDAVEREVGQVLDVAGAPVLRHVVRWTSTMPIYTVGHRDRIASMRRAMRARPTWFPAGAPYDGVGVPDCVGSGRRAAAQALAVLGGLPRDRSSDARSAI